MHASANGCVSLSLSLTHSRSARLGSAVTCGAAFLASGCVFHFVGSVFLLFYCSRGGVLNFQRTCVFIYQNWLESIEKKGERERGEMGIQSVWRVAQQRPLRFFRTLKKCRALVRFEKANTRTISNLFFSTLFL